MICTGIADEKKSRLTESHLNLICKCSGCESSCEEKLLPSLLEVDDVYTIISFLEYILFHCCLTVLRPDMGGGSQHLSDVIFGNCQSIKSSRHFQITLLFFSYEKKRVLSATWRAGSRFHLPQRWSRRLLMCSSSG